MKILANDKFITGGLRLIGGLLALMSVLCLGMWLYAMLFDSLNEAARQATAAKLIGFVGFGAFGFFLLALARLIEIGHKIAGD